MKNTNTLDGLISAIFLSFWALMTFSVSILAFTFPVTVPLFVVFTVVLFLPSHSR
jgi:hypothetical protein